MGTPGSRGTPGKPGLSLSFFLPLFFLLAFCGVCVADSDSCAMLFWEHNRAAHYTLVAREERLWQTVCNGQFFFLLLSLPGSRAAHYTLVVIVCRQEGQVRQRTCVCERLFFRENMWQGVYARICMCIRAYMCVYVCHTRAVCQSKCMCT